MTTSSAKPKTEAGAILGHFGLSVLLLGLPLISPSAAQPSRLEQAQASLESGQLEQAQRLAVEMLRGNPRNPQAHVVVGSVLLLRGQDREAEKSFSFALNLDQGVRPEVGRAYLLAAKRYSGISDLDRTDAFLSRAIEYDPRLRGEGVEMVLGDALARFSAGRIEGKQFIEHWLSRFPDYLPNEENDLFSLAAYYKDAGNLAEAKALYLRCSQEFPDGELGRRAAKLLRVRKVTFDRLLAASCSAKLFVKLRSLELGFDFTRVEISLVWVSEDRNATPTMELRIAPNSRIETSVGAALELAPHDRAARSSGQKFVLSTDALYSVTLEFPPVPRDQQMVTLILANNVCGTNGGWGSHTFRFADLFLKESMSKTEGDWASSRTSSRPEEKQVAVFHLHDYFVAAGKCAGTITFSSQGISYQSSAHSFEISCEDVIQVAPDIKSVVANPLVSSDQAILLPTLRLEARIVNKNGKEKNKSWHFFAQDGTPPVLLLAENLCRSGQ